MEARYKLEAWGKGEKLEREIAIADDIVVARAAFDAAVGEWPTKHITLRQGTRVIRENNSDVKRPQP